MDNEAKTASRERDVDPVRLEAAVRDVVRPKFPKESIALMAARMRRPPAELERTLAREYLREVDAAPDTPPPAGPPDPRLMSSADRRLAIERKTAELTKMYGTEALFFHLRRRMTIADLAESIIDHPEEVP